MAKKHKDIAIPNRKRFEELGEAELMELIRKLDMRRNYLCYLLETKFKQHT